MSQQITQSSKLETGGKFDKFLEDLRLELKDLRFEPKDLIWDLTQEI